MRWVTFMRDEAGAIVRQGRVGKPAVRCFPCTGCGEAQDPRAPVDFAAGAPA